MNNKDIQIFTLLVLVFVLAYRLYKLSQAQPQEPTKRDDPLNLAGFDDRQKLHDAEIRMGGKGKKQ
jgi:hypothetical protein